MNNMMRVLKISIFTLAFANLAWADLAGQPSPTSPDDQIAKTCTFYGQYVVVRKPNANGVNESYLRQCAQEDNEGPFKIYDLWAHDLVDKLQNTGFGKDNKALDYMPSAAAASSKENALKAIKDYMQENGGDAATINLSWSKDENAKYIADKLNEFSKAPQGAESRANTVDAQNLAKWAGENKKTFATMTDPKFSCEAESDKSPLKDLKILKVIFTDGATTLMSPIDGNVNGTSFEFTSPANWINDKTGLPTMSSMDLSSNPQVPQTPVKRKIKFENNGPIWMSGGQEYPIKSYQWVTPEAAVSERKPKGAKATWATCEWQRIANSSQPPSAQPAADGPGSI